MRWCREMLALSPFALRLLKASFNADEDGLAGIQQLAHDANLLFYGDEEAQEGRDAYEEKRRPDFEVPRAARDDPAVNIWVEGARPRTLPAAVVPVLVGTACAAGEAGGLIWWRAAPRWSWPSPSRSPPTTPTTTATACAAPTTPAGGSVRCGWSAWGIKPPAAVKRAALLSFGVAGRRRPGAGRRRRVELLVVGAASFAAGWFYTGGPKPYGYLGLGELFVFVFFGVVATVGSTYVQIEEMQGLALAASVPVGFLATALLVVNNLRDIPGDTASGKRTLAVRMGDAAPASSTSGCSSARSWPCRSWPASAAARPAPSPRRHRARPAAGAPGAAGAPRAPPSSRCWPPPAGSSSSSASLLAGPGDLGLKALVADASTQASGAAWRGSARVARGGRRGRRLDDASSALAPIARPAVGRAPRTWRRRLAGEHQDRRSSSPRRSHRGPGRRCPASRSDDGRPSTVFARRSSARAALGGSPANSGWASQRRGTLEPDRARAASARSSSAARRPLGSGPRCRRCADQHQASHQLGVGQGEVEGEPAAHRVADVGGLAAGSAMRPAPRRPAPGSSADRRGRARRPARPRGRRRGRRPAVPSTPRLGEPVDQHERARARDLGVQRRPGVDPAAPWKGARQR